jgi:hypothetical protein
MGSWGYPKVRGECGLRNPPLGFMPSQIHSEVARSAVLYPCCNRVSCETTNVRLRVVGGWRVTTTRLMFVVVLLGVATAQPTLLTPAQCRVYDMGPVSRTECDHTQLQRPPDPHTSASFKALRASGHRLRDVRDLMELMRDKTLAFNGDSVTEQVVSALTLTLTL